MRINSLRLAFLILAASLDVGPCLGQTPPQSCFIPLVATRYNPATSTVQLVEGLAASDLTRPSISTQSSLEIEVNREIYKHDVHYPQVIYPCTIPPSSRP